MWCLAQAAPEGISALTGSVSLGAVCIGFLAFLKWAFNEHKSAIKEVINEHKTSMEKLGSEVKTGMMAIATEMKARDQETRDLLDKSVNVTIETTKAIVRNDSRLEILDKSVAEIKTMLLEELKEKTLQATKAKGELHLPKEKP